MDALRAIESHHRETESMEVLNFCPVERQQSDKKTQPCRQLVVRFILVYGQLLSLPPQVIYLSLISHFYVSGELTLR